MLDQRATSSSCLLRKSHRPIEASLLSHPIKFLQGLEDALVRLDLVRRWCRAWG